MKQFFFTLIICILFASCSPSKENGGCGTENYKHKFRARLMKVEKINIGYKLSWRRANNYYVSYCSVPPDSLKIGGYYCL